MLNDQRRAFSDEYVNMILTTCESFIEISAHSPLAQLPKIMPQELKNLPCILVTSAWTHGDEPIRRTYCAFWKKTNDDRYVRDFAKLLRAEFSE